MNSLDSFTNFMAILLIITIGCKDESNDGQAVINEDDTSSTIEVEYIAHASFILKHKEYSILIDPYADTTWIGYFFPRNIQFDAIFSTHPHYDHDGGIFRDLKPYWEGQYPLFQDPGNYSVGGFRITGLKGKHCDPYGKEFDQKNTIFIFEAKGIRIAHWGDNGPITDSLAAGLKDIDILMLPIDDSYHILQKQEINDIVSKVKPKIIIPMHYKIPELEPNEGRPKNLESIDLYFKDIDNVVRLENNTFIFDKKSIADSLSYMIFKHSEKVLGSQ